MTTARARFIIGPFMRGIAFAPSVTRRSGVGQTRSRERFLRNKP
jgi:hypothetical protein